MYPTRNISTDHILCQSESAAPDDDIQNKAFTGEICVVYVWYLRGTCVVYVWYLCGICVVYNAWYTCGVCVVHYLGDSQRAVSNDHYQAWALYHSENCCRAGYYTID